MTERRYALLRWVLAPLCLATAVGATADEEWVAVRGPDFEVISNGPPEAALRVAHEVRRAQLLNRLLLARSVAPPPASSRSGQPLRLFALAERQQLDRWLGRATGEAEVEGAFFAGPLRDEIVLALKEGDARSSVVLHEMFHAAARRRLAGLPAWLDEGLAQIWSAARWSDGVVELGGAQPELLDLVQDGSPLAIEDLLVSPRPPGGDKASFYARSWLLTQVLLEPGRPGWRDRLDGYLAALSSAADEVAAFESSFGRLEAVRIRLRRALQLGELATVRLAFPREEEVELGTRRLPRAEAAAAEGEFLVQRGRRREARPLLERALELAPGLVSALEAMGHLHFADGDEELAQTYLGRAVRSGEASSLAHLRLAVVIVRQGREGGSLARAEELLGTVVSSRPELAPVWVDLAAAYAVADPSFRSTVRLCRRAVEVRPASAWFHLLLARSLLLAGDGDAAVKEADLASRLATRSADPVESNNVCWYGGVGGLGDAVLPACDAAVARAPDRGLYRDSRGLVRALTGDLAGALQDFLAFLESEDAEAKELRESREAWVAELRSGRNPFDPATLGDLSGLPF